jgi:hypothetical protein
VGLVVDKKKQLLAWEEMKESRQKQDGTGSKKNTKSFTIPGIRPVLSWQSGLGR